MRFIRLRRTHPNAFGTSQKDKSLLAIFQIEEVKKMLTIIIFLVLVLALVIWIVIKYRKDRRAIEVLAITLAIIALIPFATAVCLYFMKRPTIKYQIDRKVKFSKGDKYIYEAMFGIRCEKGEVLLRNLFILPKRGIFPVKLPSYGGDFQYVYVLGEGGYAAMVRIDIPETASFTEMGFGRILRFESKRDEKELRIRFIVYTMVDPFKQGFLSIFQTNYNYRYLEEIVIDFEDLNRQEGYFKKRY